MGRDDGAALTKPFRHRVLITGGNGYLGKELIRQLLEAGAEVHAIANKEIDQLNRLLPSEHVYSLSNDFRAVAELVEKLEPEAIFHLAAVHAEPPDFDEMMRMLNSGLLLGIALMHGAQNCRHRPVFIHAGSYWQFDDKQYAPNTFYSAGKQALDDFLCYYRRMHALPSVTLVLYDIFGPADSRPKLWSKILSAAPGSIFPTSEGRQRMELVHVFDVARAFMQAGSLLLAGEPLDALYAVRSGVRITLRELLEAVQARIGLDLTFDWGAIPYWPGQIFEPWQGTMLCGWQPSISPVDGIAELLTTHAKPEGDRQV